MKRVSKFELMRIIAMYLIVLHHAILHGVLKLPLTTQMKYPDGTTIGTILEMGGEAGVFLFVLITGFFMSQSKISLKKIFKTWLPVFFWSFILYLIFQLSIFHQFSIKGLIKAILPITFNQYWFVTVYFFMYCSIPFLNPIVESLNTKKQKQYFLILGLILIIAHTHYVFGSMGLIGSNLLSFYIMYCIGGLFRKGQIFENLKTIKFIKLITGLIFIIQICLISLFVIVGAKFQIPQLLFLAEKVAVNPSFLFVISDAIGYLRGLDQAKLVIIR